MVNNRNGFTYVANITVLSYSLLLFLLISNPVTDFTILCLTCICLGGCTTLFYSFTIKEKLLTSEAKNLEDLYRKSLLEPANKKQHPIVEIDRTEDLSVSEISQNDIKFDSVIEKQVET